MTMRPDAADGDILERLRRLAGRVGTDHRAPPELQVFGAAAEEIQRLRGQLDRISRLAHGSRSRPGTTG